MMVYLFSGIISFLIIYSLIRYLKNLEYRKYQSLLKIIFGGILLILSIFLLFRGFYYFSGPLLAISLWLTRLKTLYNFYNLFFRNNKKNISMDKNEAFEILGLDLSATRDDIIDAHRSLIEKNHPDKGGSDYLSAKINKARDILLSDEQE